MDLEKYIELTQMKIGDFCEKLGIAQALIFRYRKKTLRPSYHHALRIIDFSNGLVTFADLGWKKNGEKILWTKKELRNNFNSDGMPNNDTIPTDTMDPTQKAGTDLL